MSDVNKRIEQIVKELVSARREYDALTRDEPSNDKLGSPSSPVQIRKLEGIFGGPLPPSYRAFMEQHDGWRKFRGDADLLAVEDYGSEAFRRQMESLDDLWAEDEDGEDDGRIKNPVSAGAYPVLIGPHSSVFLFIDKKAKRRDGEADHVLFGLAGEERRFESFDAFLQYTLEITRKLIDLEKKGRAKP